MTPNLKQGDEMTFDVFGDKITGTYKCRAGHNVVRVTITKDSSGVLKPGEETNMHLSYLVEN